MPRHYIHKDDKYKKYDCCYSCYKSKKSSRRERSNSYDSSSTISTHCKCNKCIANDEIKYDPSPIIVCKQDNREPTTCCDKSIIIIVNMK